MAGRPLSLRAVRERLFSALRAACTPWRHDFVGRAPRVDDVENAFLRAAVAWETFLSDWFLTAVALDPSKLGGKLQRELLEWTAKKYGLNAAIYTQTITTRALKTSLHFSTPSYSDIRDLLDPDGRNKEFRDLSAFRNSLSEYAAAHYVARADAVIPAANAPNARMYDAAKAIRNYLAHYSPNSRSVLQGTLHAMGNAELAVPSLTGSIGGYLKHRLAGIDVSLPEFSKKAHPAGTVIVSDAHERRRILLYCAEFVRIAWGLVPVEDS